MKTCFRNIAIYLLVLVTTGLTACVQDDDAGGLKGNNAGGITLTLTLPEAMSTQPSRANINSFNKIKDLNLIAVKDDGIIKIYYFDKFENKEGDPSLNVTDDEKATIIISKQEKIPADAEIYLLANYGKEVTTTTLADLLAITDEDKNVQGKPQQCYMFAKAEEGEEVDGTRCMSAQLERTTAMITLVVDGTNLREGVKIEPQNIRLFNVPLRCTLASENKAGQDNCAANGDEASVIHWGNLGKGMKNSIGGHEDGDFYVPLFLYENIQPDGTGSDIDKNKKPAVGTESYCTYIEFEGIYTYDNPSTNKSISGKVLYRYYIGKDGIDGNGFNKFDIVRNSHYKITLKLNDLAVVEGGQLDENGNLNTTGKGDWRVETELDDFSYSVPANVLNGCGTFFPVEVESNGEWSIQTNTQGKTWLWYYHNYGDYGGWESADMGVNVSSGIKKSFSMFSQWILKYILNLVQLPSL